MGKIILEEEAGDTKGSEWLEKRQGRFPQGAPSWPLSQIQDCVQGCLGQLWTLA